MQSFTVFYCMDTRASQKLLYECSLAANLSQEAHNQESVLYPALAHHDCGTHVIMIFIAKSSHFTSSLCDVEVDGTAFKSETNHLWTPAYLLRA